MAREFNDPGEFVTFLAYESSHAKGYGGDNNVYFLDDDAPYFWVDVKGMDGNKPTVSLETLWEQMEESGKPYFTVPHHTGRAGKYRTWNEAYYNPEREPLFEIYSSWGSSEMRHSRLPMSAGNKDEESYFVDALKAGARFGVIASSDDHASLPGSIHHHRTQPLASKSVSGPEVTDSVGELRFTDEDALERIAVRGARYHPEPFVVYYARVEDNNGAHQWTSPIWIDIR